MTTLTKPQKCEDKLEKIRILGNDERLMTYNWPSDEPVIVAGFTKVQQ